MENIGNINENTVYYDINTIDFIKLIKNGNFFHGRYNDGEFNSIMTTNNPMNSNNVNCDGHQYFYQLGVDTKQTLLEYKYSDNYIISGGKNYFNDYKKMFIELYDQNPNLRLQNSYVYYDIIMNPKYFDDFNDFLNTKKIIIVGPDYMRDIKLFKNFEVIEIPRYNCYLSIDLINKKISDFNNNNEEIIYCFIASMMSNIIIHKFSKIDTKNSYLNIGSAWDYFFQSNKYNMIHHRGIYPRLVSELNQYYSKYIIK